MSYTIITAILLASIALSLSSVSFSNTEQNVLARFYPTFAQIYRPATLNTFLDEDQTVALYQFFFTEKEYLRITEESITMLNTNVTERTITYHAYPNYERVGSRYFYRRDPSDNYTVEIELVNANDYLFREVEQPNRYFYLSSFDNIQFSNQIPIMPYYEVSFICNSTFSRDNQSQIPLLSYIDRSFHYTPRYSLDFSFNNQSNMYAYVDIRNTGEQSFVIQGAELVSGDIQLTSQSFDYSGFGISTNQASYRTEGNLPRPFGEDASGTYVYQLLSSTIKLPAHSVKTIGFFEPNVTVASYAYYSSIFSPVYSDGKLLNTYNLTSFNNFLPNGRLYLREQGRFLGQIDLPDLSMNDTYTMMFGFDADVSYTRRVVLINGDDNSYSSTYYVEYIFKNSKPTRDVQVYFFESFNSLKYFQLLNLSTSNQTENNPDVILDGTDLRGYFILPRENVPKNISYNLITYKSKPGVKIIYTK